MRSSSLQEDGFGNAFAGKYESVFCLNSCLLYTSLYSRCCDNHLFLVVFFHGTNAIIITGFGGLNDDGAKESVIPMVPKISKRAEHAGADLPVCVPEVFDALSRPGCLLQVVVAHIHTGTDYRIQLQKLRAERYPCRLYTSMAAVGSTDLGALIQTYVENAILGGTY